MLVVHYGKTIVEWRKAGYHLQPDQDAFRWSIRFMILRAHFIITVPILPALQIACKLTTQGSSNIRADYIITVPILPALQIACQLTDQGNLNIRL